MSSSFGTESAVLLSIVAEVDPCTPVLFLQTGMLFPETLAYAEQLAEHLGLSNIWQVRPDGAMRRQVDPDNDLWITDP
ncbi:MAG: phosphoadenosine phosphosulfate reductase family protein, partial [Geminicoccaceae bacterium]